MPRLLAKWVVALFVASLCILPLLGALYYHANSVLVEKYVADILQAIEQGGSRVSMSYVALQAAASMSGLLPASIVSFSAGAVFGIWAGFYLSAIGIMVGAALAFGLTRTVLRPHVERRLLSRPFFRKLDRSILEKGWQTVCLLRVSPIMPFAMGSYGLGLTSIGFGSYIVGTLASLPALFGYVVLGHLAREGISNVTNGESGIKLTLIATGAVATIVLILYAGKIVKNVIGSSDISLPDAESIETEDLLH